MTEQEPTLKPDECNELIRLRNYHRSHERFQRFTNGVLGGGFIGITAMQVIHYIPQIDSRVGLATALATIAAGTAVGGYRAFRYNL